MKRKSESEYSRVSNNNNNNSPKTFSFIPKFFSHLNPGDKQQQQQQPPSIRESKIKDYFRLFGFRLYLYFFVILSSEIKKREKKAGLFFYISNEFQSTKPEQQKEERKPYYPIPILYFDFFVPSIYSFNQPSKHLFIQIDLILILSLSHFFFFRFPDPGSTHIDSFPFSPLFHTHTDTKQLSIQWWWLFSRVSLE